MKMVSKYDKENNTYSVFSSYILRSLRIFIIFSVLSKVIIMMEIGFQKSYKEIMFGDKPNLVY